MGDQPKPDVVVTIIGVVVVARGAAGVVLIVIPRPAPQHPVSSACACNTTAWAVGIACSLRLLARDRQILA